MVALCVVPLAFAHPERTPAVPLPHLSAALPPSLLKAGRIAVQLALIVAVCLLGDRLAALLPIDVPGNICSMVLLLAFLLTGVVKAENIQDAADFLLKHMAVFFVPAGVAVMGSYSVLAGSIAKLLLVCLLTTVLVFFVTSLTVTLTMRALERRDAREAAAVPASLAVEED
jgi:holin-like protein